jgi:hypothetical protein
MWLGLPVRLEDKIVKFEYVKESITATSEKIKYRRSIEGKLVKSYMVKNPRKIQVSLAHACNLSYLGG